MELLVIGIAVGIMFWIVRLIVRVFSVKEHPNQPVAATRYPHPQASPGPLRRSRKLWLAVAGVMLVLAVGFVYVLQRAEFKPMAGHVVILGKPPTGNVQSEVASGYFIASFYFLMMLAGMAAEYMFGLKKFKQFTLAEFVRPFWVSLIVFSVPWSLVDRSAVTFGSVLACYQNGFFWKKVLDRKG